MVSACVSAMASAAVRGAIELAQRLRVPDRSGGSGTPLEAHLPQCSDFGQYPGLPHPLDAIIQAGDQLGAFDVQADQPRALLPQHGLLRQ